MYVFGLTQVQRKQSWAEIADGNTEQGVLGTWQANAALTAFFGIGFKKIPDQGLLPKFDLVFLFLENTVPEEV